MHVERRDGTSDTRGGAAAFLFEVMFPRTWQVATIDSLMVD